MKKYKRLVDEYTYPGFLPLARIKDHPDKPGARIITLKRRQKKLYVVHAEKRITDGMTGNTGLSEISPVETLRYIWKSR